MSANVFNLFLIPGQQWRVPISTKQKSPEFLAQQEGTLIVPVLSVLVFWEQQLPSWNFNMDADGVIWV